MGLGLGLRLGLGLGSRLGLESGLELGPGLRRARAGAKVVARRWG